MAIARKKLTILILIVAIISITSLSLLGFAKKLYGYTADYEEYYEYWQEGTDTCIEEDYTVSVTDSGSIDYPGPDGEHYYGDYTAIGYEEGHAAGQSYSLYVEWYEEGIVENAKEEDCGYQELSGSGSDTYTEDGTECTRNYDWELEGWHEQSCPGPAKKAVEPEPPKVWVRDHDMTCFKVWVNEEGNFEFVFWWEYKNNNHVQIYDMADSLVWETDFKYGDSNFEACLPDGMYTVKTFHEAGHILQEFVIGK